MGFVELALLSSIAPQTLAVVLYLLGGRHGLRHAWLFVAGLLAMSVASGLLVVAGMVDLGIHVDGLGGGRRFPAVYLAGGVLLVLFAAYIAVRHARARSRPSHPERTRDEHRLERMVESSWVSLGVGLVFGLPGIWYALALAEVSGDGTGRTLSAVFAFSLISYSWAWIPVLWFMADHQRALRVLTRMRAAVGRHRIAIVIAVLLLVGAYLIVLGVLTG